ncbi:MAG TPA: bifunctional phosphopantothenoylcysteine decarboxylase/phosphopantothenate--cysteine ligase CoaBC [Porticoccaceae bacterium]|nr:bifunctional phosphopantothenoylcysteine decarboxylase/phosphopantothenate--cysteine ligase CoaBC [Porticoccaceae bacterium]
MSSLHNKHVLVGVTGGIAAYKSAELVRQLQKAGATVRVMMTPAAQAFVTPLTFQALSGYPVHTELLDPEAEAAMGHIELARWADLILIAPASADFLARLCHGDGNDLVTTVCLASKGRIAVAPAMNQAMWANISTQENIAKLVERGIAIFGPGKGYQACGDIGEGRMEEVENLVELTQGIFTSQRLAGKKVVITAGPTREALDPVRYITNHSSGKMGYALAAAAVDAGAETILISGPVNLPPPERVQVIHAISAQDMLEAALEAVEGADIFIASAAVADYRPAQCADQKIKKKDGDITITLTKNPDIVATVSALEERPFTVGFAAETNDVEAYARKKLTTKKLDLVIANDVSSNRIGFNSDDNQVTLVSPEASETLALMSKANLATYLVEFIASQMAKK